jgi:ribonuclease HI
MTPAKKHKYYVVWKGRRTGIFKTWEECSAQVTGFIGARYKSFNTLSEAEKAFKGGPSGSTSPEPAWRQVKGGLSSQDPILESYSVDAACSGSPGPVEFRGVSTRTGKEFFHEGPYEHGTNNVGEFLAIVHALQWLKRKKLSGPLYSDSATAIKWVKRKVCNTTLAPDKKNAELFQLITQAEAWLRENKVDIPILKWETGEWGEIPADFNRK